MATNAGTLTIKVRADTSGLERDLRGAQKQILKTESEHYRARRNAARWETAASAAAIGATGLSMYRSTRKTATNAKTASDIFSGLMKNQTFKLALRAVGVGGVAFGAIMLGRRLFGRRKGAGGGAAGGAPVAESDRSIAYLASIAAESRRSTMSLLQIQASQKAQVDILNRGRRFQERRMVAAGTQVTMMQANAATAIATSRQRLDESREAIARERAVRWSEWQVMKNNAKTTMNESKLAITRAYYSLGGNSGERSFDRGGSLLSAGRSIGRFAYRGLLNTVVPGAGGYNPTPLFANARINGEGPAASSYDAFLSQLQTRRGIDLQKLMKMGPANVMSPAATIGAGSDAEYAARVRMQRQEMQGKELKQWRDKVIALLTRMVADSEGKIKPEAITDFRIQSGDIGAF